MTDPRNIAHDKKVHDEKKHHHEEIAPGAEHTPQPGKKPHLREKESTNTVDDTDQSSAGN